MGRLYQYKYYNVYSLFHIVVSCLCDGYNIGDRYFFSKHDLDDCVKICGPAYENN